MIKRSLSFLLILMMVFALPVHASPLPFRDDVAAINDAAGSVLMLLVYQNKGVATSQAAAALWPLMSAPSSPTTTW